MFVGSPNNYTWIASAILATVLVGCSKNDDGTGHWSDPVAIAADSGFQQPAVAVLGQSQRLAVWAQQVQTSEPQAEQTVVNKSEQGAVTATFVRKVSHQITRVDLLAASSVDGQLWTTPTRLQQGSNVHTRTIKRDKITDQTISNETVDYPVDAAPHIAAAANGDAVATWTQTDGTLTSVFAARYAASSQSWGTVTEIDGTTAVSAFSPQAIMLTSSSPMVVFTRAAAGGAHEIVATLWVANAWSTPTRLSSANCGASANKTCNTARPRLAGNGNGTAFAVWEQESNTVTNGAVTASMTHAYAAAFSAGSWGSAQRLSDGTTDAARPSVAVNASGNAWAGWEQQNASLKTQDAIDRDPTAVWVMPYTAGTGWTPAARTQLKTDDLSNQTYESFGSIDLVLDAAGTVTAAWEGQQVTQGLNGERPNAWDNTDVRRIWAARKTAAGAWETPVIINSFSTFELGRAPLLGPTERRDMSASAPRIVLADASRIVVAWTQESIGRRGDSGPRIHSSFYQTGTGWSAAERVSADIEITEDFAVATDGQGRAVTTWSTSEGLKTAEIK